MINALRYEPRGQRQRFEPRERQSGEREKQDRHIHLHVHLNLTLRASQKRSTPIPHATRIMRIFAALVGATVIPLWFFYEQAQDPGLSSAQGIFAAIFLAGIALAWLGCFPLLVSNWRAIPRARFTWLVRFLVLFALLPYWMLTITWFITYYFRMPGMFFFPLVSLLSSVYPLISAVLLAWASREGRALRQTATAHSRLSLVIVGGMALMLLAALLFNFSLVLSGAIPLVAFLLVMCAVVIVALRTLLGRSRSPEHMQARPKDASPSDVASSRERGYYPVDPSRKEDLEGEP